MMLNLYRLMICDIISIQAGDVLLYLYRIMMCVIKCIQGDDV